ncbi:DUF2149 domain-containing protein [Methanobrevibacter sp.]|uniref:DUF2149 domain-containing protein n=1 Tax=Methanobrevibacter sp. TaxID=66852 RepID=UPI00388E9797
MVRKKQRRRSNRVEEDPMAGTANLVDAMLVIAVGFLVFVIISWNMQSIVFNEDMSPEQRQQVMQNIQSMSEVNQGHQLNETPDISNSSGQGYTEMGKVYKDPSTGRLIMVEG